MGDRGLRSSIAGSECRILLKNIESREGMLDFIPSLGLVLNVHVNT